MEGKIKKRIIIFIATGASSGYLPFVPGTFGTLVGVGIYLFLSLSSPLVYGFGLFSLSVVAIFASTEAEKIFKENDHYKIVIDEIVGFLLTMFWLPRKTSYIIGGFLLFRLLDTIKPFPANIAERRLKGGLGIVADDLVASIYANIILQGIRYLL